MTSKPIAFALLLLSTITIMGGCEIADIRAAQQAFGLELDTVRSGALEVKETLITELDLIRDDVDAAKEEGAIGVDFAKGVIDRLDKTEAKADTVADKIIAAIDVVKVGADKLAEMIPEEGEEVDLVGTSLEIAGMIGVPGTMAALALWARLRKRLKVAKKTTENVVRSFENAKDPDGSFDWKHVGKSQDHFGIRETVRDITKMLDNEAEERKKAEGH